MVLIHMGLSLCEVGGAANRCSFEVIECFVQKVMKNVKNCKHTPVL